MVEPSIDGHENFLDYVVHGAFYDAEAARSAPNGGEGFCVRRGQSPQLPAGQLHHGTHANRARRERRSAGATSPLTFAFPCGSDKKGLGASAEDYAPLVAERFVAARVSVSGVADPNTVDLLHVPQLDTGGKTGDQLKKMVDDAIAARGWLVLLFHGVGNAASCNGSLAYAPDKCMINT